MWLVVVLNTAMFAVEVAIALALGSVSLLADSVDFLEDASLNFLVIVGLRWSPAARARLGKGLAVILVAPSVATLGMAWVRFGAATPPAPGALGLTGVAALAVNSLCAALLMRHRAVGGSLLRAAYLSARNDTIANLAIIVAAVATAASRSAWPDLVVGLGIGLLNAGAAREVWQAAAAEQSGSST